LELLAKGVNGYLRDVQVVFEALDKLYEYSDLGNKDNPLDELVYILLSLRTPEARYQRAYQRVFDALQGDWERLLYTDEERLRQCIGDAGLSAVKASALKQVAEALKGRVGSVSLDCLSDMPTAKAEAFLRSLPGVGTKVAKCVLMCSLNRAVFPLDTHCYRVGRRLGWFAQTLPLTPRSLQDVESSIPEQVRKRLHVRLIQHGRAVCKPKVPHCEKCVLTDYCDYFRSRECIRPGA
jgi:endonuclease III